jgi:hypothetical protein
MARASEQANHSAGTEACLPRTAVAFPGQHASNATARPMRDKHA